MSRIFAMFSTDHRKARFQSANCSSLQQNGFAARSETSAKKNRRVDCEARLEVWIYRKLS